MSDDQFIPGTRYYRDTATLAWLNGMQRRAWVVEQWIRLLGYVPGEGP